jgi:hypothetical protein
MIINGIICRKLKVGEIPRRTDVHNDGHSVFQDMVGKPLRKSDMKFYSVYRPRKSLVNGKAKETKIKEEATEGAC